MCRIFQIRGNLGPYPAFSVASPLQSELKNATIRDFREEELNFVFECKEE